MTDDIAGEDDRAERRNNIATMKFFGPKLHHISCVRAVIEGGLPMGARPNVTIVDGDQHRLTSPSSLAESHRFGSHGT